MCGASAGRPRGTAAAAATAALLWPPPHLRVADDQDRRAPQPRPWAPGGTRRLGPRWACRATSSRRWKPTRWRGWTRPIGRAWLCVRASLL